MAKLQTTVGVTAGIFNTENKLLLRRRTEHDSITDIDYAGNWELPIVAARQTDAKSIPYNYLSLELRWGIFEETGLVVSVDPMPPFYPVMFLGPQGYDLAMITSITPRDVVGGKIKEETIFVSPDELNDLARAFISLTDAKKQGLKEARGLLSGFGKRQHCMALKVFEVSCLNPRYREEARQILTEIQKDWPK